MKSKFKVGDTVKITQMCGIGKFNEGLIGKITKHPNPGVYFGTWGELPLFEEYDTVEKIKEK